MFAGQIRLAFVVVVVVVIIIMMLLAVLFQSSRVFSSLHVSGERKCILCIKDLKIKQTVYIFSAKQLGFCFEITGN